MRALPEVAQLVRAGVSYAPGREFESHPQDNVLTRVSIQKMLLWSSNLWAFAQGLLGPLFAIFATSIGGDILDISGIYAAYLVVMGLATIFIGYWIGKHNGLNLMVLGYFLASIATYGYILVDSSNDLIIVQILLGLSVAFTDPPWYSLYDKHSDDDGKDGEAWGNAAGWYSIMSGFAILVGGFIVQAYSFNLLFLLMGTTHLSAAILQLYIVNSEIRFTTINISSNNN